ncbi:unnamed protein product, partial [Closterium sp. NIES-53]
MAGIERLMRRNEASSQQGGPPAGGGVALPFILVQTRPQATVEVEISEDMQLVHFDFSTLKPPISLSHLSFFLFPPSTPFELQGDRQLCAACDGPLHSSPSSTEVP